MNGLVNGESEYYLCQNKNGSYYAFHVNGASLTPKGVFNIEAEGLIIGESSYLLCHNKKGQFIVLDRQGKRIHIQPMKRIENHLLKGFLSGETYQFILKKSQLISSRQFLFYPHFKLGIYNGQKNEMTLTRLSLPSITEEVQKICIN